MKKQTIISILFLIISLQLIIKKSNAQTYFNNEYRNDSSIYNNGAFVHQFSDSSGYLVVNGITIGGETVYTRFHRLNLLGDTIWTKLYGTSGYAQWPTLGNYISIGDTNFVFTGIFAVNSSDSLQTILFKIDSSGTVLWDYRFGEPGKKTPPSDIKATPDGGYIITGWTTGWGITNAASSFLLKLDSNGIEEWHKVYGGGSFRESYSVEVTADSGYIMSGRIYQSAVTKEDINVVRTDSLGNLMWSKTYGTPEEDNPFAYITKYGITGDYIVVGAIDIVPGNILDDFQGYIARINGLNGNVIWADTMGVIQNGVQDGFISNVIVLPDGNIVGTGRTHYQSSTGGSSAWIVKYDGAGNLLWQRIFNKYGGNSRNILVDIHQTYDGGFILCGDIFNVFVPEKTLWVLKLDSNGCEIPNCTVGVAEEILPSGEVRIYPNPSSGIFTLETASLVNTTLNIYNVAGQLVLQKTVTQNTTKINLTKQPKGLYLLKIIHQNQVITKRIIKY